MTPPANDDVAVLVQLAGTSDPIAAARVARVRAAVHGAWRDECFGRQTRKARTRRRWLAGAVLLAAAASVAIAVAIWPPVRTPVPVPVVVAHIDQVGQTTGLSGPFKAGGAVMSGSTVTTSAGTLAMTLTSGVQLRLDASSAVRMDSGTDVTLERGAVYVDSADAQPGFNIDTPAGLVRDIGTQFEVRLAGDGVRVRVRDGQVRVIRANGVEARAAAGEELFSAAHGAGGTIRRRPVATTGREWAWAERAAPTFSAEGKTLGAFLEWVSREGAWTVTFADTELSKAARATVLYVRPDLLKGKTPAEALDIILPTCGLRHDVDRHRVVIKREIGK